MMLILLKISNIVSLAFRSVPTVLKAADKIFVMNFCKNDNVKLEFGVLGSSYLKLLIIISARHRSIQIDGLS